MTFWKATLETPSVVLEAYGESESHANALIVEAWKAHQRSSGDTTPWEEVRDDVWATAISTGEIYRDNQWFY